MDGPKHELDKYKTKFVERHCISNHSKTEEIRKLTRRKTSNNKSTYLPRRSRREDRTSMEEKNLRSYQATSLGINKETTNLPQFNKASYCK